VQVSYEITRRFQESWAVKLHWAECVKGANGLYDFVRCIVCTTFEVHEKILQPKWNTLKKHGGKRKAKSAIDNNHTCRLSIQMTAMSRERCILATSVPHASMVLFMKPAIDFGSHFRSHRVVPVAYTPIFRSFVNSLALVKKLSVMHV
jgi:hypothetical protein